MTVFSIEVRFSVRCITTYFTSNLEYFPKREIASYDFLAESKDLPYERIEVLNKIRENKVDIVILSPFFF